MQGPIISFEEDSAKKYVTECFLSQEEGRVVKSYNSRLYTYKNVDTEESSISKYAYAGICPDFLLN